MGRARIATVVLIMLAATACNRTEPVRDTATAPPATTTSEPRGDRDITTAVQAKYYGDEQVRGHQIDVSASGGVVTLRGSVQSEEAKQQAVALARSVEGVSSVNDELQVRTASAANTPAGESDAPAATGTAGRAAEAGQPGWITTKIQSQYFIDPDIKPWNIDVTTMSGGVVTLEGAVDTAEKKAEAVRIARETEGVTRVEDRLRVEPEARRADAKTSADAKPGAEAKDADTRTGVVQPDAWVTAKIQAKYFIDDDVKGRDIDVDTREGLVTLKGTVTSEAERRQAIAIARNTDGVREVKDELRIDELRTEPSAATSGRAATEERTTREPLPKVADIERPDPWITMKIQSKFFLDADVKGHEINVDTTNGVVRLKGSVSTAQQKQQAEQIARETDGVKRVINELAVGVASGA